MDRSAFHDLCETAPPEAARSYLLIQVAAGLVSRERVQFAAACGNSVCGEIVATAPQTFLTLGSMVHWAGDHLGRAGYVCLALGLIFAAESALGVVLVPQGSKRNALAWLSGRRDQKPWISPRTGPPYDYEYDLSVCCAGRGWLTSGGSVARGAVEDICQGLLREVGERDLVAQTIRWLWNPVDPMIG